MAFTRLSTHADTCLGHGCLMARDPTTPANPELCLASNGEEGDSEEHVWSCGGARQISLRPGRSKERLPGRRRCAVGPWVAYHRCELGRLRGAPKSTANAFARERWPDTPTLRGSGWWEASAPGRSWSLREDSDAAASSPLTVRRIVADGAQFVAHACATMAPRSLPVSSRTNVSPPPRHG